jgi:hypothetical protein
MHATFAHIGVEPSEWLILFHEQSTPWVSRLCPGRFKHVSALAHVPDAAAWVSLSWELARLRVGLIADRDFERWFAAASADAAVLRMKAPAFDHGPLRLRAGLTCISMVKHLIGLRSGALWPAGLWRDLVAQGAEIVSQGTGHGKPAEAENQHAGAER